VWGDNETEVVSASGKKRKKKTSERMKMKEITTILSHANLDREATFEKMFHSSSHLLGFPLLFI